MPFNFVIFLANMVYTILSELQTLFDLYSMNDFKASISDVTIRHEITMVPLGLKYVKTQALQIYDFYFDGSDTSLENLGH